MNHQPTGDDVQHSTYGFTEPETWPGQRQMIAAIIGTTQGLHLTAEQLERLPQWQLEQIHKDCRATYALPTLPVPDEWAERDRQRDLARQQAIEPAKRFKAVVWDKQRNVSVHVGCYVTQAEADAAKTAALARRAMGLPLRERDLPGAAERQRVEAIERARATAQSERADGWGPLQDVHLLQAAAQRALGGAS